MPGRDSIRDAPLPTLPAKKAVIDWTARYRATTLDVQRYSRFVGVMKRALPMAAAALLIAVVAYSLQPRIQNSRKLTLTMQKIGILNNDLMMIKPKLTGVDGDGNPYVVTAEEAVQDAHDSKRAQLRGVEADMSLKNGQWLNLTATRGLLDETKQKLRLQGVIDVYTDRGFEAHTTLADVDMHTGIVSGNVPINGQGPLGTFRADKYRIDRGIASKHPGKADTKQDKTKIYLYGNVQMTIYKARTAHS
jgi:lipopolysaccharide export system protein LptC